LSGRRRLSLRRTTAAWPDGTEPGRPSLLTWRSSIDCTAHYPSDCHPFIAKPRLPARLDASRDRRRHECAKPRYRLTQRRSALRVAAYRRAHRREEDIGIYLWRRRRDWLRDVEE